MLIDVRELIHTSGRIESDAEAIIDDPSAGEIAVPCHVSVDYRRTGVAWHLNGTVRADWETRCARCVEPVHQSLEGDFLLVVQRDEHGGENSDEVRILGSTEHEVDIGPLIQEAVVLATPMVVLCREDCAGLCPECGVNRNHETCACGGSMDSRWDALRKLK